MVLKLEKKVKGPGEGGGPPMEGGDARRNFELNP